MSDESNRVSDEGTLVGRPQDLHDAGKARRDIDQTARAFFFLRLNVSSNGPHRGTFGTTPVILSQRLRQVDTLAGVSQSIVQAIHSQAVSRNAQAGWDDAVVSRFAQPFPNVIATVRGQDHRSPDSLLISHARYRNPLELWLTFFSAAGGLGAIAGSFVAISRHLRDWGSERSTSASRARIAAAEADEIEGALALRLALRARLIRDVVNGTGYQRAADLDWDGIMREVVNIRTAPDLLALAVGIEDAHPTDEIPPDDD